MIVGGTEGNRKVAEVNTSDYHVSITLKIGRRPANRLYGFAVL